MNPIIIAETKDYLIINKPAGLMVHGDGRSTEPTLVDWILEKYSDIAGVGEDIHIKKGKEKEEERLSEGMKESESERVIKRPGIVHRLDRDTSGVMIIARTPEFFDHMKKQFQDHTVQKIYRAYLYGHVKQDHDVINASRGTRGEMREAITEYTVLMRGIDHSSADLNQALHADNAGSVSMPEDKKYTYIEFRPRTGRTHQIRVHAKYLNHPVVGDELYGGKLFKRDNLGFKRQALHAFQITFTDVLGEQKTFQAPLPEDFLSAQELL
jgi:23S rRNA pseudouridine1911/1915/1917 synthase